MRNVAAKQKQMETLAYGGVNPRILRCPFHSTGNCFVSIVRDMTAGERLQRERPLSYCMCHIQGLHSLLTAIAGTEPMNHRPHSVSAILFHSTCMTNYTDIQASSVWQSWQRLLHQHKP